MINLNKETSLQEIKIHDYSKLYDLMSEIYPTEYSHFWLDDSSSFINNQFNKENLEKELSEKKQQYFFVIYKNEIVGILRLLLDYKMAKFPTKKTIKIHRIYLHNKVQGKGVGKLILNYVENFTKENNYNILWLEAMEKKPQALNFYKNFGFNIGDEYLYEYVLLKKEYQKMIAFYKEYIF